MLSGSSGGFLSGLELVEARQEGGIRLALPARRFSLSIENTTLDVTAKKVTNCAVPSYCVACGLIGADPPGTYKPCVQARLEAGAASPYTLELELADTAGEVIFRAPEFAAGGDSLRYVQLPLYSMPNRPFSAGWYIVTGRARSGGEVIGTASLLLRID
jgi:hypothetical protein